MGPTTDNSEIGSGQVGHSASPQVRLSYGSPVIDGEVNEADVDEHVEVARPPWVRTGLLLVSSLLWAILCDLVVDTPLWLTTPLPWFYSFLIVDRFAVGVLFVWLLMWLLIVTTGRVWFSLGFVFLLAVVVSVANLIKISYLTEPLVPSDLVFATEPQFLLSMVPLTWLVAGVFGLAAFVLAFVACSRRFPLPPPWTELGVTARRRVALRTARATVALIIGSCLLQASSFAQDPENPWRQAFDANGAEWASWDAYVNYLRNGFVGGFLYSLPVRPMEVPTGYSQTVATEIASRYAQRPDDSPQQARRPNVVVILCESCSDPLARPGVALPEDPLVNFREIAADSWSGELVNWRYGTGTSAMEFQVLTGQSMALFEPQLNTPFSDVVAPAGPYPSVVEWFNQAGYGTTAIHPFRGSMYRRSEAYEALGFSSFLDDSDMTETARLGPWISDQSALDQVQGVIESSDAPQFVHLVTMQNHTPAASEMPSPMSVDATDLVDSEEMGGYARGMQASDEALADFITDLDGLDESTTVLFFGDHLPPIYESSDAVGAEPSPAFTRTPFLIWSPGSSAPSRNLGVVSPTALMPLVFQRSAMSSPPYFRLLNQQRRLLGTIERTQVTDRNGVSTRLSAINGEQQTIFDELRLVQYDLSIGNRFTQRDLWGY